MILTSSKARVDAVLGATSEVATSGALFEVSETKKRKGLRPRGVVLVQRDSTYGTIKKSLFVPVLTKARYDAINLGQTLTVDGQEWSVYRKEDEEVGT